MKISIASRLKNRIYYHTKIQALELKNQTLNHINPEKSILIFANPRGGSTWLAELLRTIPSTALILEPLFRGKIKSLSALNFTWHQYIPQNEHWPEAKEIFRKLFNRELLDLSIIFENDLSKLNEKKIFPYKFCHGNMLLPWVVQNFDVNPILFVRHPCSVVASQIEHSGWSDLKTGIPKYGIPDCPFNDYYLLYKDILQSVKTLEENLAATWSLTMTTSAMHKMNNKNWITVAYESLYTDFDTEIERIFERLGLPIPQGIYQRRLLPSKTTSSRSVRDLKAHAQLGSWKNKLSLNQQKSIIKIVNEFGIDFYDLSPSPNLDKLYST